MKILVAEDVVLLDWMLPGMDGITVAAFFGVGAPKGGYDGSSRLPRLR